MLDRCPLGIFFGLTQARFLSTLARTEAEPQRKVRDMLRNRRERSGRELLRLRDFVAMLAMLSALSSWLLFWFGE